MVNKVNDCSYSRTRGRDSILHPLPVATGYGFATRPGGRNWNAALMKARDVAGTGNRARPDLLPPRAQKRDGSSGWAENRDHRRWSGVAANDGLSRKMIGKMSIILANRVHA